MGALTTLSLGVNIGIFAIAAGGVWLAGTALARYANVIAEKKVTRQGADGSGVSGHGDGIAGDCHDL